MLIHTKTKQPIRVIRELQLLDELFLSTDNSKYSHMKTNYIIELATKSNMEDFLGIASISYVEYGDLLPYEKEVIHREIIDELIERLERASEKRDAIESFD